MAKIVAGLGLGILGTIDGLSIYKMRGIEHPVIRRKGGPSKEKIRTDPKLHQVRNNISEFAGRAKAAKYIMRALQDQKPLADHNIAGRLNAMMMPIQVLDGENDWAKRSVRLSAYPQLLNGFSLNRNNPFDSTIRFPLDFYLSRETGAATVQIPDLLPGISFFAPDIYPWFRVIVSLGLVPDVVFAEEGKKYMPVDFLYEKIPVVTAKTSWYPVAEGSAGTVLDLTIPSLPGQRDYTLVLSAGICYGKQQTNDLIIQARHAGCAKVLVAC